MIFKIWEKLDIKCKLIHSFTYIFNLGGGGKFLKKIFNPANLERVDLERDSDVSKTGKLAQVLANVSNILNHSSFSQSRR